MGIAFSAFNRAILSATQSFSAALFFFGGILLIGALSYIFVVNKVERIELSPELKGDKGLREVS